MGRLPRELVKFQWNYVFLLEYALNAGAQSNNHHLTYPDSCSRFLLPPRQWSCRSRHYKSTICLQGWSTSHCKLGTGTVSSTPTFQFWPTEHWAAGSLSWIWHLQLLASLIVYKCPEQPSSLLYFMIFFTDYSNYLTRANVRFHSFFEPLGLGRVIKISSQHGNSSIALVVPGNKSKKDKPTVVVCFLSPLQLVNLVVCSSAVYLWACPDDVSVSERASGISICWAATTLKVEPDLSVTLICMSSFGFRCLLKVLSNLR